MGSSMSMSVMLEPCATIWWDGEGVSATMLWPRRANACMYALNTDWWLYEGVGNTHKTLAATAIEAAAATQMTIVCNMMTKLCQARRAFHFLNKK